MSKTYTAKLAEAIAAKLHGDHPFTITADPEGWDGHVLIGHPNGVLEMYRPVTNDKRRKPTEQHVEWALTSIRHNISPQWYYVPTWQAKHREASADWDAALNHNNPEGA